MSLEVLNTFYLTTFVIGLIIALGKLIARVKEYHDARLPRPVLLKRDFALMAGLALPFLLIFIRRALALDIADEIWWSLLTGTPAVIGIWYWVYQEFKL